MYVWGVNSTVTKHSDYFVWKDTSECVTRRYDNTVDKKRMNSGVLEYLFWREFSNQKNRKNTRKLFLRRATHVTISNFGIDFCVKLQPRHIFLQINKTSMGYGVYLEIS